MKRILLLLLLLIVLQGYGQYYNTGQNPASVRWKSIDTPNFRILFPEQAENKARYIAALFTDLYNKVGKSLNIQPRKFTAILNTYSAISNGMVAWAPKRMELYTTSPQNNEPQLWLNHLATHEYRHVIQMNKVTQGLTRLMNYVLGEQATAMVVGFYLPFWFLEGDAVCAETALTPVGRGRMPEFQQLLKAQLIEKGSFHYDKAINGSFKDFIPNRYKLGYYMVGVGRANYGTKLWDNALNRVGRNPFGIASFSAGIKQVMRLKRDSVFQYLEALQKKYQQEKNTIPIVDWQKVKKENRHAEGGIMLYHDVMKQLAWEWKIADKALTKTSLVTLTPREQFYTNKRFPYVMENGDIIYLKEGLNNALQFWQRNKNGKEQQIFTPGYLISLGFDYRNHTLLWAEQNPSIRWQKADKSVLVTYNLQTQKRKIFKQDNSLFSPAFNADGSKIAAISVDKKGDNALLIINSHSNKIEQQIPCQYQTYMVTPKWFDKQHIVAIKINQQGKQLVWIDLQSKKEKVLLNVRHHQIKNPVVHQKMIYFSAGFTGIDNLFAYSVADGKIYQITSSRFGASDAHIYNNTIYYADYTSDGYVLAKTPIDKKEWKQWNGKFATYPLADKLTQQVGKQLMVDTLLMQQFKVKKYAKWKHLFNLHSWAPIAIDMNNDSSSAIDIGVSVGFQNTISTMQGMAGYRKKEGFQNGQFFANISYKGWFPIIDTEIKYGVRQFNYFTIAQQSATTQKDTLQVRANCKNMEWKNSIRIPLNLSSGQFSRSLIPKITYNYVSLSSNQITPLRVLHSSKAVNQPYQIKPIDLHRHLLEYSLVFYNLNKKAQRDIQSRWGQLLALDYRNTPFGNTNYGYTWAAQSVFYFPGIGQHDGVKLYGGYQYQQHLEHYFSEIVKNPRGISNLYYNKKWSASVNYTFPLCYPDLHIGSLVYFKRCKINAFYDFCSVSGKNILDKRNTDFSNQYFSTGAEITADSHLFHLANPVDMGIRIGYENQSEKLFTNFIFRISFN